MTARDLLPHLNGALNAVVALLLVAAFAAIRRGRRALHARLMISAIGAGVLFFTLYVLAFFVIGHRRFPGDDWVRTVFLVILGTHELCAVIVVPLLVRTVTLARRERFDEHRRIVRYTYPVWLYVAVTGVLIYWMNNHLRPPG
jgi:putative membrane protein